MITIHLYENYDLLKTFKTYKAEYITYENEVSLIKPYNNYVNFSFKLNSYAVLENRNILDVTNFT